LCAKDVTGGRFSTVTVNGNMTGTKSAEGIMANGHVYRGKRRTHGCTDQFFLDSRPQVRSRDIGLLQNSHDFVGALDYGGNENNARECSRAGDCGRGAARACGVSDKMPRWRHEM